MGRIFAVISHSVNGKRYKEKSRLDMSAHDVQFRLDRMAAPVQFENAQIAREGETGLNPSMKPFLICNAP
jgi:hypothetical protein